MSRSTGEPRAWQRGAGSRAFGWVAALLSAVLVVNLSLRLERAGEQRELARQSLYLPSGRYLRHASLGFRTLLADVLFIWSVQYYSVPREQRWRHLQRFYEVITDLDPRYREAYVIGALILGWEAGRAEAGLELLDKGVRENPDSWELAFEAGYYAWQDLKDRERALHYLGRAKDSPVAPGFVSRWYHHVLGLVDEGSLDDALGFWIRLYQESEPETYQYFVAERHVHDLRIRVDLKLLREAVATFRERFDRLPISLEELRARGVLAELPLAPDGQSYRYERANGEVESPVSLLTQR